MIRLTQIKLPLDHNEAALVSIILKKLRIDRSQLLQYTIARRGYDARDNNDIKFVYTLNVETTQDKKLLARFRRDRNISPAPDLGYEYVAEAPHTLKHRPIIIGLGPCGLFAALTLAQMGFQPIVLERGKAVRERTKDTFKFWRKGILDPESNVQFGEGGAGTFSDGKLYSQVKRNRRHALKVKQEFVNSGAAEEILYASKPHIGTLRLVKIVEEMRNRIIDLGGEIRFESKVADLLIHDGKIGGVVLSTGETLESDHVILAVGHSARDTFEMLHQKEVHIDAKPFSVGFRIEHPQSIVDSCRFGKFAQNPALGAADYKLVHHAENGRTVYSFCMCPGGTVVAATSEPDTVVTNGMSHYSRAERNANAGIVVGITADDYGKNPLDGIAFQRELEKYAFVLGGSNYCAPAQMVSDFLANQPSTTIGSVSPSYTPGVQPSDLSQALPSYAIDAIREAIPAFNKQIDGYAMDDAILTAVETRTSSPIRITRGKDRQSVNVAGLYPAGEGAGYAGGILSAGIDGIRTAEAVAISIVELASQFY